MEIEIMDQIFRLLPQKAILWIDAKTLLIGDLHLGKVTHFRKEGIAIPATAHANNIKRLDELVIQNDVERIILLGDLFHNKFNDEWKTFAAWRNNYQSIDIQIVLGNHDILPHHLFHESSIGVNNDLKENSFLFTHHPKTNSEEGTYVFSGHIHPVYCLRSPAKQSLKFPCFIFDKWQAILPSFGVFTGGYEMKKQSHRKIYVIADNKVIIV